MGWTESYYEPTDPSPCPLAFDPWINYQQYPQVTLVTAHTSLCISVNLPWGDFQVYVAASTSANLGHGYSLVLLMLPLWEMLPPSE